MEMITHSCAVLPKGYVAPITSRMLLGIEKSSHKEVKAEIADTWEIFIEKKEPKESTNQALPIKRKEGKLTL
jgi:hypothetical protein